MSRVRIGCVVAMCAALACGGPSSQVADPQPPQPPPTVEPTPEPDPEPEMDYFTEDLDTGENLIPALKIGAERLECGLVGEEGQKVVYECPSAVIVIVQSGTELRYVCERATPDACQQLMSDIIDAVLAAAEG